MSTPPQPRFYSGWHRTIRRIPFAFRCLGYLLRPARYPLFLVRGSRNGLMQTLRIEKMLGLTKTVGFNGAYFTSTTVPHYPSAAFDHAVARGILNLGAAGTSARLHVENVILGITRRCDYGCVHCYERRSLARDESVSLERWKGVLAELQAIGVSNIIFSGGEPMLRYEGLRDLLRVGNKELSDFHLHTSGHGVTGERAHELRDAGLTAAAVGLDDVEPERFDRFRGYAGAFRIAMDALRHFNRAGVYTYANLCPTPALIRSGDLWRYFELAREMKVGMIQILEPRPCGGYAGRPMDDLMTDSDRRILDDFVLKGNTLRKYRKYPLLYSIALMESPARLGCTMGGLSHFTIDPAGDVRPCVFVPVSFGNILHEDLAPIFARMRSANPRPIHRTCPSILIAGAVQKRRTHGAGPVPYEEIAEEWHRVLHAE